MSELIPWLLDIRAIKENMSSQATDYKVQIEACNMILENIGTCDKNCVNVELVKAILEACDRQREAHENSIKVLDEGYKMMLFANGKCPTCGHFHKLTEFKKKAMEDAD